MTAGQREIFMKTMLLFAAALAYAAITAPAKAQSDEVKVDYSNGQLSYYYTDCGEECTFAFIGCEDEPWIQFRMDQEEIAAWIAKSNALALIKVGEVSIEIPPDTITLAELDESWWPNLPLGSRMAFWELLKPGQTLEITAGPNQLTLAIPKEIEDLRKSCKPDTE